MPRVVEIPWNTTWIHDDEREDDRLYLVHIDVDEKNHDHSPQPCQDASQLSLSRQWSSCSSFGQSTTATTPPPNHFITKRRSTVATIAAQAGTTKIKPKPKTTTSSLPARHRAASGRSLMLRASSSTVHRHAAKSTSISTTTTTLGVSAMQRLTTASTSHPNTKVTQRRRSNSTSSSSSQSPPGRIATGDALLNENNHIIIDTYKMQTFLYLHSNHSNLCIGSSSKSSSLKWSRRVWCCHIAFSTAVLLWGIGNNPLQRKYIPAPSFHGDELDGSCQRPFVNVMASSATESGAIVCCDFPFTTGHWQSSLCSIHMSSYLPFASRLAKFPDAWLLPLFPLMVRLLHKLYQTLSLRLPNVSSRPTAIYTCRRVCLYIAIMVIRGWILYVSLNALEDRWVTNDMDQLDTAATTACWYQDLLRAGQPQCYGRIFDFSDHIVLYFAQILPIPIMELLVSFQNPYWLVWNMASPRRNNISHNNSITPTMRRIPTMTLLNESVGYSSNHQAAHAASLSCNNSVISPVPVPDEASSPSHLFHTIGCWLVPVVLVLGMMHLYLITMLGAYKTALYFHTAGEITAGFAVSWIVQAPMGYVQCSSSRIAHCLRRYLWISHPIYSNNNKCDVPSDSYNGDSDNRSNIPEHSTGHDINKNNHGHINAYVAQ